jgi:alginate export protein
VTPRTLLALALLLAPHAAFADEPAPGQDPLAPAEAEPAGEDVAPPPSAEAPAAGAGAAASASPPAEDKPWRLADQLPEWFHVEGTFRARNAYVTNALRRGVRGDNRAISLRTTILLELRGDPFEVPFRVGFELIDSRLYNDDSNLALSTGMVNAVEPLQAYLSWDMASVLPGEGVVRAGRLTADFGSRRLVARNRFRNTINSFTGVELDYTHEIGWRVHGILASPIQRLPSKRDDLDDNKIRTDREHEQVLFWGGLLASPDLGPWKIRSETYFFGLHEDDASDRATRDRELYTPGFRVYRKKARAELDFEVEGVYQFGRSRRGTGAGPLLDHSAFFVHLALGYTFDHDWKPRLILQYDYASGDRNPNDGDNNQFDTLFGARRFEFGATGIFGPIARNNVSTPGLRFEVYPIENVRLDLLYRAYWLANERDAWTAARVQDANGSSSSFVAHLFEFRGRWEIVPKNIRLEAGAAAMVRGSFARRAPGANAGEHLMTYAHVVFKF